MSETVLQGLRQVADVLAAIDQDAALLAAETHAVDAAQASLNLTRESYRAGNVGVLQVLDAERPTSGRAWITCAWRRSAWPTRRNCIWRSGAPRPKCARRVGRPFASGRIRPRTLKSRRN